MAASVPVTIASNQSALPVTGTFYQATQPVSGTFWQATQPVSIAGTVAVSGPLTDTQLRATALPVSLASTTITGSVAVTGAFYQGTQPVSIAGTVAVSGPLTDTQLRATAVPVSLASTTITGSVAVTGPITDTQIRATPLPISGTVTTGGLTDTQIRATALPVSIAATVNTIDPDAATTGNITTVDLVGSPPMGGGTTVTGTPTAGSYVALACPGGDSSWQLQVAGTWIGVLYFEASLDSTNGSDGNWINVNGRQTGVVNTVLSGGTTRSGVFRGNTSGWTYVRVRASGTPFTGTAAIVLRVSAGAGAIFLNASIPAGTNNIGRVALDPTLGGNVVSNPVEQDLLGSILVELQVISTLLQSGLAVRDEVSDIRSDLARVLN